MSLFRCLFFNIKYVRSGSHIWCRKSQNHDTFFCLSLRKITSSHKNTMNANVNPMTRMKIKGMSRFFIVIWDGWLITVLYLNCRLTLSQCKNSPASNKKRIIRFISISNLGPFLRSRETWYVNNDSASSKQNTSSGE